MVIRQDPSPSVHYAAEGDRSSLSDDCGGVAPPQITTRHVSVGIIAFVAMQIVTVALVFFHPQLALWPPKAIGW